MPATKMAQLAGRNQENMSKRQERPYIYFLEKRKIIHINQHAQN